MNILVRNRELLKNIKVGDVVMESLTFDTHRQSSPVAGKVIYIHPNKRFYRVEFEQPGGRCVESYSCYSCAMDRGELIDEDVTNDVEEE